MKIKDGVVLEGLDIAMRTVLIEADLIWKKHEQELVVTSGLEGTHSAGSFHYYGLALDLRTRYFDKDIDEARTVKEELQNVLSSRSSWYDVVLHSTHIHVECHVDREY